MRRERKGKLLKGETDSTGGRECSTGYSRVEREKIEEGSFTRRVLQRQTEERTS